MGHMSSELDELRQKIDAADHKLIETLTERMKLVETVGTYKRANGIDPVDFERLQEILSTRAEWVCDTKLSENFVRELFELIHKESVEVEKKA